MRPERPARPEAEHGFRPDVQGLRAIAVALVVIYHLYPSALPGGYVGVDVFFVISGYLITGHLARGLERTGRVRLLDFYGRRARRLLPAAALVLTVTWLLSRQILPITQLPATATQTRASALYFQNWTLAHDAVDYLAQEAAPTPVQHFWSLSVEEQFYLVWPLLFVLAAAAGLVARRARRSAGAKHAAGSPRLAPLASRTLLLLAVGVVAASLTYSVLETNANPAAAYYITTTRMWELGLGGVLALLPAAATRRVARVGVLAWLGFGAIVVSALLLSGASRFPGWVALFPVLGAVLMLACGSGSARLGPAPLTASRPFVFVGDISYSLYLWHWPLIVLWLAYHGGTIGVLDGPAIIVASVVLAWGTKVLVEDRVRRARIVVRHPGVSLATASAVVVPAILVSLFLANQPAPFSGHIDAQHRGAAALAGSHRTGAAHRTGSPSPQPSATKPARPHWLPRADMTPEPAAPQPGAANASISSAIPPLADAPGDLPLTSHNHCEIGAESSDIGTDVPACTFGDTTHPTLTVALVGDSHAGQWSTDLDRLGRRLHWRIVAELHSACRWTSAMTVLFGNPYTACHEWGVGVLHDLLTKVKPDVVIVSERPVSGTVAHPQPDAQSWRAVGLGMAGYLRQLIAHGIRVVAIHETPEPGRNVPDCLASHGASVQSCSTPASQALWRHTPIDAAAAALGKRLPVVNLDHLICGKQQCLPIVGNVIVYRDEHHLTQTFALTLQPFLRRALLATRAFGRR